MTSTDALMFVNMLHTPALRFPSASNWPKLWASTYRFPVGFNLEEVLKAIRSRTNARASKAIIKIIGVRTETLQSKIVPDLSFRILQLMFAILEIDEIERFGLEFVGKPADLEKVIAEVDILSLHLHLNSET